MDSRRCFDSQQRRPGVSLEHFRPCSLGDGSDVFTVKDDVDTVTTSLKERKEDIGLYDPPIKPVAKIQEPTRLGIAAQCGFE